MQSTTSSGNPGQKRRRVVPVIWLSGVVAAGLLAVGVTGSLSGFTASITNTHNVAGSGTLLMTETGLSGVSSTGSCYSNGTPTGAINSANASNCSIINKFGGQTILTPLFATSGTAPTGLIPPTSAGTAETNQNTGIVQITNNGTAAAAGLALAGSTCTQSSTAPAGTASDFCSKLDVAMYQSATAPTSGTASTYGTQVFYGTAATLASFSSSSVTGATVAASGSVYLTFVVWVDAGADNTYQGLNASEPLTWTFSS